MTRLKGIYIILMFNCNNVISARLANNLQDNLIFDEIYKSAVNPELIANKLIFEKHYDKKDIRSFLVYLRVHSNPVVNKVFSEIELTKLASIIINKAHKIRKSLLSQNEKKSNVEKVDTVDKFCDLRNENFMLEIEKRSNTETMDVIFSFMTFFFEVYREEKENIWKKIDVYFKSVVWDKLLPLPFFQKNKYLKIKDSVSLAIAMGDFEAFEYLVKINNKPELDDETYEKNFLYLAVAAGKLNMVKYLLHCGASINYENEDGENVYYIALQNSHLGIVEYIYRNSSQSGKNYLWGIGLDILYEAVKYGKINLIRHLFENIYKYDINIFLLYRNLLKIFYLGTYNKNFPDNDIYHRTSYLCRHPKNKIIIHKIKKRKLSIINSLQREDRLKKKPKNLRILPRNIQQMHRKTCNLIKKICCTIKKIKIIPYLYKRRYFNVIIKKNEVIKYSFGTKKGFFTIGGRPFWHYLFDLSDSVLFSKKSIINDTAEARSLSSLKPYRKPELAYHDIDIFENNVMILKNNSYHKISSFRLLLLTNAHKLLAYFVQNPSNWIKIILDLDQKTFFNKKITYIKYLKSLILNREYVYWRSFFYINLNKIYINEINVELSLTRLKPYHKYSVDIFCENVNVNNTSYIINDFFKKIPCFGVVDIDVDIYKYAKSFIKNIKKTKNYKKITFDDKLLSLSGVTLNYCNNRYLKIYSLTYELGALSRSLFVLCYKNINKDYVYLVVLNKIMDICRRTLFLQNIFSDGNLEVIPIKIIRICSYCKNQNAYKLCGRCRNKLYCSRRCQKKHWNTDHRNNCTKRS